MTANPSSPLPARSRFVILGASGHMAKAKLLPALWSLEQQNEIGSAYSRKLAGSDIRSRLDAQGHSAYLHVPSDAAYNVTFTRARGRVMWDTTGHDLQEPETYRAMKRTLDSGRFGGSADPLATYFYCAVRPSLYGTIATHLVRSGLLPRAQRDGSTSRIILEKPFGFDSDSARSLLAQIEGLGLDASQVLLVDHYLYKPMVDRFLELRRLDDVVKDFWRPENIDHVQITVAECEPSNKLVETYNQLGALGDMIQSHLLLLLRVATMEPSDRITSERGLDDLSRLVPHAPSDGSWVELGQCLDNEPPGLEVDTFAALGLRMGGGGAWASTPFFLRTGKQMRKRVASIAAKRKGEPDEWLICRIQPEPAVMVRRNGRVVHKVPVQSGQASEHATIYRELVDQGTLSRAVSYDWAIAAWPIVDQARRDARRLRQYAVHTDGPPEADRLLSDTGRRWLSMAEVLDSAVG